MANRKRNKRERERQEQIEIQQQDKLVAQHNLIRALQIQHDLYLQLIADQKIYGMEIPVRVLYEQRYRRLMA